MKKRLYLVYVERLFVLLAMVFILRSFTVAPLRINGSHLEPHLMLGDLVLLYKLPYGLRWPGTSYKWCFSKPSLLRGKIYAFWQDEGMILSPLLGLPGDIYETRAGVLWINHQRTLWQVKSELSPAMVGVGGYLVYSFTGDVYEVPKESLDGRVGLVLLSLYQDLKRFHIRWDRIFHSI